MIENNEFNIWVKARELATKKEREEEKENDNEERSTSTTGT
jgi:hypothetical protein